MSPLSGPLLDWRNIISWVKLDTVEDYDNLLAMYEKLPTQVSRRRNVRLWVTDEA